MVFLSNWFLLEEYLAVLVFCLVLYVAECEEKKTEGGIFHKVWSQQLILDSAFWNFNPGVLVAIIFGYVANRSD